MKRKITISLLIILSGLCNAQIQNGNFENWTTTNIDIPNGWHTSFREAFELNLQNNATQYTPGHTGNYAIRLETIVTSTDTVMAYFSNSQEDPMSGEGGVPYTMKPDSFYCWAKLGIQPQDTGLILAIFKKNSNIKKRWNLTLPRMK